MIFEIEDLRVTTSLDPSKGKRYIESTRRNEIDNLYNLTAWMEGYVNLKIVLGMCYILCMCVCGHVIFDNCIYVYDPLINICFS
jgi:hypothetical protein